MSIVESKNYPAPRPSPLTLFLRTFFIWQLVRFILINLRMTVMIVKSHGRKQGPPEPKSN